MVLGILMGLSNLATSQNFEGIAHFQSSMNMDAINVAGNNMDPAMQEALRKSSTANAT